MKEAIQKAIEGGWHDNRRVYEGYREDVLVDEMALLDPLFWQALGKSMGWKGKFVIASFGTTGVQEGGYGFDKWIFDGNSTEDFSLPKKYVPEWRYRMYRFIDHLAEGKDAESFFSELLAEERLK